jgi:hypothetical protein
MSRVLNRIFRPSVMVHEAMNALQKFEAPANFQARKGQDNERCNN